MSTLRRVVAALVVGVATLFLAAAGAPASGQPDNSCLRAYRDRLVSTQGVQGRLMILVETTKSERGRIRVYVTGDLISVHAVDGTDHTLAGVLSFQFKGEAQQQPSPFRLRATPSGDANAFFDSVSATGSNGLDLDGYAYLGKQVRAVLHVAGNQYATGWATIGRGEPACQP